MFDELSEKVSGVFSKLRGRGVLSDSDIKEGLREMRRVLLEADVSFQLTREFLERVEQKAVGVSQIKTVAPAQQLVKIVYDELTAMLGERREGLTFNSVPPTIVMLVGPPGLRQDDDRGQAGAQAQGRGACDETRRRGRVSSCRHRPARDAGRSARSAGACGSHHEGRGEDRPRRHRRGAPGA
jgi:signal recognition particle subunit SRP54